MPPGGGIRAQRRSDFEIQRAGEFVLGARKILTAIETDAAIEVGFAAGQILRGGEGRPAGQIVIGERRFAPARRVPWRARAGRSAWALAASALIDASSVRMAAAESPASSCAPPRSASATGILGCGPSARSREGCRPDALPYLDGAARSCLPRPRMRPSRNCAVPCTHWSPAGIGGAPESSRAASSKLAVAQARSSPATSARSSPSARKNPPTSGWSCSRVVQWRQPVAGALRRIVFRLRLQACNRGHRAQSRSTGSGGAFLALLRSRCRPGSHGLIELGRRRQKLSELFR